MRRRPWTHQDGPDPPLARYSVQVEHADKSVERIGITTDVEEACRWAGDHYASHGLRVWVAEIETGRLIYQLRRVAGRSVAA